MTKRMILMRVKIQVQHLHSHLSPSPLPSPQKVRIHSQHWLYFDCILPCPQKVYILSINHRERIHFQKYKFWALITQKVHTFRKYTFSALITHLIIFCICWWEGLGGKPKLHFLFSLFYLFYVTHQREWPQNFYKEKIKLC